jgi:lipopolysaccharide transport system permease protein
LSLADSPSGSSAPALVLDIWRRRSLLAELSMRELQDRYIDHALGGVWAVLNPLLTCLLYLYLFTVVFPVRLGLEFQGAASLIWLLSGLTMWLAVTDVMGRSMYAISGSPSLVRQVVFPVEVLPAQVVVTSVPTYAVGLAVVLGLVAYDRPGILLGTLWMLPLALLLLALTLMGLSFLLASLAPFTRDLREVINFFGSAGLFMAPILYFPPTLKNLDPGLRLALNLNPFTHLLACLRDALFYGTVTAPASWAIASVFALALAMFGAVLFQRVRSHFAEAV